MNKKRDTFIFYRSFHEALSSLEPEDRLLMYDAITEYCLDFKEPRLTGVCAGFWTLIHPLLDANRKRWENGNKPKKNQTKSKTEAKQKQDKSKDEAYKDKDKDKDRDYTHTPDHQLFGVPSIQTPKSALKCQEYFTGLKAKHGYTYDAEQIATKFFEHYAAKGWMVNGDKITNWQFQANKWARAEKDTDVPKIEYKPSW